MLHARYILHKKSHELRLVGSQFDRTVLHMEIFFLMREDILAFRSPYSLQDNARPEIADIRILLRHLPDIFLHALIAPLQPVIL